MSNGYCSKCGRKLELTSEINGLCWKCEKNKFVETYFITIDKQVIADCITLLTQSGSNTKEQVLKKLRGLVE